MNEATLRKAQNLRNDISNCEQDLRDIENILADFENIGSSIEFRKNSSGWSRSFGSKKYGFRSDLMRQLLESIAERIRTDLERFRKEFDEL